MIRETRDKRIVDKFLKGETQTNLGKEYGMTKENIRKRLNTLLSKEQVREQVLKNFKAKTEKNKKKGRKYICKNCGKTFKDKYLKRKFCSTSCFKEYRIKNMFSDEEKKQRQRERVMAYYHKTKI